MTTLTNFFAAAGLAAITLAAPAFAEQSDAGSLAQAESLTDNTLKAFAYDWYARFDNGASIDELAPNLPDAFEFVYPQATVTSLDAFAPLHKAAQEGAVASAHDIEEIYVHPTAEDDLFEIVTPHTYLIARKDGTFGNIDIDIVSRMRVRLGLETNSAAQIWAAHQPHNISIRHTEEGFAVRFIVHFEGEIEGVSPMRLTNVTNWLLVEEEGELRLRDYALTIL